MDAIQIRTRKGASISFDAEALNGLGSQLRGLLLSTEDSEYEAARKVWNGTIDKKPALIVRCLGVADVMAAVNFARDHQLLLSIRAGGHNVSGSAIAEEGLVIDVSQMRSVQVDPQKRLARVESGARLGDLDHETTAFGLAAPVGVVSQTGVAGLTLHGGAGWLMRKHGLSIDNLNAVELVTADGRLLRASETEHSDLFWALRGGGGNFGVVTAFEFKLHPVGPEVAVGLPIYSLEKARDVMTSCRDYMANAPDDLMVLGVYWSAPAVPEVPEEHQGKPVAILLGVYTGPIEQAQKVLTPLRSICEPIADLSANMGWKQVQSLLDEDYPEGKFYYWKSIYLNGLTNDVMKTLEEYTLKRPSAESSIDVWFLGGALSRVSPTSTAFFNRRDPIMIGIEANWSNRADSEANIAWARALHKDLQPFSSGGNYLNFPGFIEERETMLRGAYGENLERLEQVKAKYDPDNLFPGLLNISPS
jgi:FAD/FMN-containing dehydrogenase